MKLNKVVAIPALALAAGLGLAACGSIYYSGAWALGGSIIGGGSYSGWVAGYATTRSVSVGTFNAYGSNQVQTSLRAVQTDGSLKIYEGTYTVSGGVIVAANIVQTWHGGMAGGPGDY